ncbi:MAG: HD-GYP domain-containing protein [Eubacterium sp.]|nr:HD-GYP domain-containing protein [Eubacterium sp.]
MYEFLQQHQLTLMLMLSGMCIMLAVLTTVTRVLSPFRRRVLFAIELAAAFILMSDRMAYKYRGETGDAAFYIVRIANFLVFFLMLVILNLYNLYVKDLMRNEAGMKTIPVRLYIVDGIICLGYILLIISQFTGLYYTFDEYNRYQRSDLYIICNILPMLAIVILLSVIISSWKRLPGLIRVSLLLFNIVPIVMSTLQIFFYGLSLNNIGVVAMVILLYVFALIDLNKKVEKSNNIRMKYLQQESEKTHTMFVQTATALANAIDAKDKYTHGHSTRVAEYSREIARLAGEDDKMLEEIYFSGLLHDVGKIGVPDAIINKDGKLTDEEFAMIKQHPVIGKQILSTIDVSPYLSIGANYHHERYDGRGYPEGLKGEDIPKMARIIAVADAYDAMTSKRSYRDPIPQQKVREEIVKGIGTQFDPEYAKIMLHMIDYDIDYTLKETDEVAEFSGRNELRCEEAHSVISDGFLLDEHYTTLHMHSITDEDGSITDIPSLILFDSLDAKTHFNDGHEKDMLFTVYGELFFEGAYNCAEARAIKSDIRDYDEKKHSEDEVLRNLKEGISFDIKAVRIGDHAMIDIVNKSRILRFIVALPDNIRFCYMGITGTHCRIRNVRIDREEGVISKNLIPRIADEISFITGAPEGDIPNIEIDGWRKKSTKGIPIKNKLTLRFHTMSLPTARLVWHCPYVSLFYSADHLVGGLDYKEYVLCRLDGENWESDAQVDNQIFINTTERFEGWEKWKDDNKAGMDVEIVITKKGNKITIITENAGVAVRSITTINDNPPQVYAALTGDQCVLTDIHVIEG